MEQHGNNGNGRHVIGFRPAGGRRPVVVVRRVGVLVRAEVQVGVVAGVTAPQVLMTAGDALHADNSQTCQRQQEPGPTDGG
ncbi:MAG TPA: hypothetical protein DD490_02690 [Acidobacteria bacterium]|nr:hypothetical protein [Acidobacteriota bacterium]